MRAGLSLREARALALRAQGIGTRPGRAGRASLRRLLLRQASVQLDSVNAVARAQELVAFSRVGHYRLADLHRVVYHERTMFEYWGHAMSWLPMSEYRYLLPRIEQHRSRTRGWWKEVREQHAELYPRVLERVRDEGPLAAVDFDDPRMSRGSWWDYKPAKLVLEDLFDQGLLMVADRRAGFQRVYDLTERVLPAGLDLTRPSDQEADLHLVLRAARALGIGTLRDIADYFRISVASARAAATILVEAGDLTRLAVEGWREPAYAPPELLSGTLRRPAHRPVLLAPFDPLVWERSRAERLFGFEYRIEIYTPEARRRYGYYVLPLLAGGTLIGRLDVRNDRAGRTLRVPAVFLEDGVDPVAGAAAAATAILDLAYFLHAQRATVEQASPPGLLEAIRDQLRKADDALGHGACGVPQAGPFEELGPDWKGDADDPNEVKAIP